MTEIFYLGLISTGGNVMLPLLRCLPSPHFSFLTLFPSYHPIHTADYLMVPPFPDPLITV